MVPTTPDTRCRQFTEEMGILFHDAGMPRMAGRIFGWLLICDPPHQSARQLADVVAGSKGSISMMTRFLIDLHLVQRMTLPGDRHTYYRIIPGCWDAMLARRMAEITTWRKAAERGKRLLRGARPALLRRLNEMHEIHAFFERELPALLRRWKRRGKR